MASAESFKHEDLSVSKSSETVTDSFNINLSDHMLICEWNEGHGWGKPKITPTHSLAIPPGQKVFQHTVAYLDGLRAFRREDSKVALLRPDLSMELLQAYAKGARLPSFDSAELLNYIAILIKEDIRSVPDDGKSFLNIRPNFLVCENVSGASPFKMVLLYLVTSVGSHSCVKPLSLFFDVNFIRDWLWDTGSKRLAYNHAPTDYIYHLTKELEFDRILCLFGKENQIVQYDELTCFVLIKNDEGQLELATPPLNETIQPGVTRQCILDLANTWGDCKVSERKIVMQELIHLNKEDRWLELFVSGVEGAIAPINLILFKGETIKIPTMESKTAMYGRVSETILDIQLGYLSSPWLVTIDEI